MPNPLICLVGYAVWTIALVFVVAGHRTIAVLSGKKKPNEFPAGTPHGSDANWRANRAHMNATENLAIYASVVIVGNLLHVDSDKFATLAAVTLGARIVQSLFHLTSGSVMVVNLRFAAFTVQLVCILLMAYEILQAAPLAG